MTPSKIKSGKKQSLEQEKHLTKNYCLSPAWVSLDGPWEWFAAVAGAVFTRQKDVEGDS